MEKQVFADNVDALGVSYKTIGENIRNGARNGTIIYPDSDILEGNVTNRNKTDKPIVTFIDDDCRIETYTKLFPVIKELGLPYGIACPIVSLGRANYMTAEQVLEMQTHGCDITCHHLTQNNMDTFKSADAYDKELSTFDEKAKAIGLKVDSICYPQGIYVSDYIPVVRKHYKMGFTTDRGDNAQPLESYFMKRVEVFPRDSSYDLNFVKTYVDNIGNNWLVFMTHSWYSTFNVAQLKELVSYIQSKGIEIVGVNEGIKQRGNLVECGIIKKPLEYISTDYTVVSANGAIASNALTQTTKSNKAMVKIKSGYNAGYNLTTQGKTPTTTDKKRVVSEKTIVKAGEEYLISASNIYGNALWVIYAEDNSVISSRASLNTDTGSVVEYEKVTMPSNASYVRIASNLNIQPTMFSIYELR